jgi:hypothetical protein
VTPFIAATSVVIATCPAPSVVPPKRHTSLADASIVHSRAADMQVSNNLIAVAVAESLCLIAICHHSHMQGRVAQLLGSGTSHAGTGRATRSGMVKARGIADVQRTAGSSIV